MNAELGKRGCRALSEQPEGGDGQFSFQADNASCSCRVQQRSGRNQTGAGYELETAGRPVAPLSLSSAAYWDLDAPRLACVVLGPWSPARVGVQ